MALLGILLGALSFVLVSQSFHEIKFFIALFLMSCGVALISPTLTALTSLHSGEQDQGFHLGVFRSSGSIARALGPILAGLAYFFYGSSTAYLAGAILLSLPFIILMRVPQPITQSNENA